MRASADCCSNAPHRARRTPTPDSETAGRRHPCGFFSAVERLIIADGFRSIRRPHAQCDTDARPDRRACFRDAVRVFAETNGIPILHLNTPDRSRWDDRKVDHVRKYVETATEPGVVVIVVAQEVQKIFMGYTRRCKTGSPQFGFAKADRRVTVYYFYILDAAFGLGFIKICSYFPYPLKMWVNGHEWAKR